MELQEIFSKVKIQTTLRSIELVFFDEEKLESTNYAPSYQRNYVWDTDKASYFIESIFIGTEVPPLIYFNNNGMLEIIDGRQRYETILKFVNNKLRLKKSGLPKLGNVEDFADKTFEELNESYKNIFKKTRLRIIEFSFNYDNHTPEDEEKLKHEIFQRYNTGITPLKGVDVGKAEYSNDSLVQSFSEELDNSERYGLMAELFHFDKMTREILLQEIRELLVINIMPIRFYAQQTKSVIKRYFDFISDKTSEEERESEVVEDFFDKLTVISRIKKTLTALGCEYNRIFSECLFWALSIMRTNYKSIDLPEEECHEIAQFLLEKKDSFIITRSSFAGAKISRYGLIAEYFGKKYHINVTEYIKQGDYFNSQKAKMNGGHKSPHIEIRNLHRYKQEPTTYDVSDIFRMVKQMRYLIRPTYQRGEVISIKKASSIIESLLLDIKLPPIFVYARQDNVYEVIDGQQRLLSILAYMKIPYLNEQGEFEHSKNEGFALNLKDGILKSYHGKHFDQLSTTDQKKLKSAGLWVVEISEINNENFDPIDLFVRLNNKPYPIKPHTFEMWNSYIKRSIIDTVKDIYQRHKSWLYLRKTNNVRMDSENILTILAYYQHVFSSVPKSEWIDGIYPDKTVDLFMAGDKLSCRLKSKVEITRFLEQKDSAPVIKAINSLEFDFIAKLEFLLEEYAMPSSRSDMAKILDNIMCVENSKRTIQGFYILWLLLHDIPMDTIEKDAVSLGDKIKEFFQLAKKVTNKDAFTEKFKFFKLYHAREDCSAILNAISGNIVEIKTDYFEGADFAIQRHLDSDSQQAVIISANESQSAKDLFFVKVKRKGFKADYVKAFFLSKRFYEVVSKDVSGEYITQKAMQSFPIPYVSLETQDTVAKLQVLIESSNQDSVEGIFFRNLMQCVILQLYGKADINVMITDVIMKDLSAKQMSPKEAYQKWSSPDDLIRLATFRIKH